MGGGGGGYVPDTSLEGFDIMGPKKTLKYEIFQSKNPSCRKISEFSFKGIERSSLLEDFLRKLEIVNLGPQGSTEENSGTF